MVFYRHPSSRFWRNSFYADLATRHLPGPALVIDVRQGSNHPPLLSSLAAELEDFTTEMQQHHVYRWRCLADCIDLLNLTPFRADQEIDDTTEFTLSTHTGPEEKLTGVDDLIKQLGRNHVDRVRNHRISAASDRDEGAIDGEEVSTDLQQTTVRVFFIVDAEDDDSMVSAAFYATQLKQWSNVYDEAARPGQEPRLTTFAICLNVDARNEFHHPLKLAICLEWQAPDTHLTFDAAILIYTYSDDEAYINQSIQSCQVGLLLRILLLLSPENTAETDHEIITNLHPSQDIIEANDEGQSMLPWPVYLVGISSLEHPTRQVRSWLTSSLVIRIIEMMQAKEEVQRNELNGTIQKEVHYKMYLWYQAVKDLVPSQLNDLITEFQVFDELQRALANSPFRGKKATWQRELNEWYRQISQLYAGSDISLEGALQAVQPFLGDVKKAHARFLLDEPDHSMPIIYQQLLALICWAAQIPASLFHHTSGMLLRLQCQLSALEKIIDKDIHPPDCSLQEMQQEIEEQVQQLIDQQIRQPRGQPFYSEKRRRQGCERAFQSLRSTVRTHLDRVCEAISAKVALALLEEAGLYAPSGHSLYRQRTEAFEQAITLGYTDAIKQQERASEQLKTDLDKTQGAMTQQSRWPNLNSSRNWVDWDRISDDLIQLYTHLETPHASLDVLMNCLLRLVGAEDPLLITPQYLSRLKTLTPLFEQDSSPKPSLFTLNTICTGILLLAESVDFTITTLKTLLTSYADPKNHSSAEKLTPSGSAILELQNAIRKAMLEKMVRGTQQRAQTLVFRREQSLARVLALWSEEQFIDSPFFGSVEPYDITAYLEKEKIAPNQVLDGLRKRNRLLGYPDTMNGEDRFYLFLPPGKAGDKFLQESNLLHSNQIYPIRFLDREKLLFLHTHRMQYVMFSPSLGDGQDSTMSPPLKDSSEQAKKAQDIINIAAVAATGAALVGTFIPVADLVGTGGVWVKMMIDLAKNAEHEIDEELAKQVLGALVTGASLYYAGSKQLTLLLHFFPGMGSVTAMGINGMLNWIYTQRLGKILAREFAKPNFDPKMLHDPAIITARAILARPHDSEIGNARNVANDPHNLGGHTDAADTTDTTSNNADTANHASDTNDPSVHANSAAHHTTDTTDPSAHDKVIDAFRVNGTALLHQHGGTRQFGLMIDALLDTAGAANLINAPSEIHVQFCLSVVPLAKRYEPKLGLKLEKIALRGIITTKEHMASIMYNLAYSKIPSQDLKPIVAQFGDGK